MEHIKKFLNSIYLGDRYCEKIDINDDIEIDVVEKKDDIYSFIVYGCNVSDKAVSTDIELHIKAKKFYIFNPVEM